MTHIICDTNIWYNIGFGNIKENQIPSIPLYAHYLTISEIFLTEKLKYTPESVRDAARAIFDYGTRVLEYQYPVFDYILYLIDSTYYYNPVMIDKMDNHFQLVSSDNENQFNEYLREYNSKTLVSPSLKVVESNKINKFSSDTKKGIIDKKKFRKYDYTISTKKVIIKNVLKGRLCSMDKLNSFDWNKIELFVNVMNESSMQLSLWAQKITPNDWSDFLQLAYVQPGNLFWTRDAKWKRIIKKIGMGHYLYEQ